jgi:serine/threonine protein kinase
MQGEIIVDFEILEEFASGGFSRVHFARHLPTSTYCAAKIVDLDRQGAENLTTTLHEISVFLQVSHVHLCNLIHLARRDSALIYFLDYLPNGTLRRYLVKFPHGLPERDAQRLFGQVYAALLHCHRTHFLAHRDVKFENILLDANLNAKLIDFGLSDTFYCHTMRGTVGTPGYTPPEVLVGGCYDETCDVWSLGVTLYRMVAGDPPFELRPIHARELIDAARALEYPDKFSQQLRDLLTKMLDGNPRTRPSLCDLQNHPFLKGSGIVIRNDRVTPRPIAFYMVSRYEDISKFRRFPITPQPAVLQACLKYLVGKAEPLAKYLEEGKINAVTAIYFALVSAVYEKPSISGQKSLNLIHQRRETLPAKAIAVMDLTKRMSAGCQPLARLGRIGSNNTFRIRGSSSEANAC